MRVYGGTPMKEIAYILVNQHQMFIPAKTYVFCYCLS